MAASLGGRLALGVRGSKGKPLPFVDFARLTAVGGTGAHGTNLSAGGDGGAVVLEAKDDAGLKDMPRKVVAKHAVRVKGNWISPRHAKDTILKVPRGTQVLDAEQKVLADLDNEGATFTVVRGGRGGDPTEGRIDGTKGQRADVFLELKSIADVGLVGFPNAGKSSLLGRISRTKPKVGAYPFTTLRPQVGSLRYDQGDGTRWQKAVTVADIPGIIEGAHENVGLGSLFLRHIERTSLLLYMVDIMGFQLKRNTPHRSPLETFELLKEELEHYLPGLSRRPSIICLNKIDLDESGELRAQCGALLKEAAGPDVDVMPVSTLTREGVNDLDLRIKDRVAALKKKKGEKVPPEMR